MNFTEIRIKLVDDPDNRLLAFCSITLDNTFVVRDIKIIEGPSGPFVAMPSRKLTASCPKCGCKNHLRASYCSRCGKKLSANLDIANSSGRIKQHADIAHPINAECRELLQTHVVEAYRKEKELAKHPDYEPRYRNLMGDDDIAPKRRVDDAQSESRATKHLEAKDSETKDSGPPIP